MQFDVWSAVSQNHVWCVSESKSLPRYQQHPFNFLSLWILYQTSYQIEGYQNTLAQLWGHNNGKLVEITPVKLAFTSDQVLFLWAEVVICFDQSGLSPWTCRSWTSSSSGAPGDGRSASTWDTVPPGRKVQRHIHEHSLKHKHTSLLSSLPI